jgi:hypothetical protein
MAARDRPTAPTIATSALKVEIMGIGFSVKG